MLNAPARWRRCAQTLIVEKHTDSHIYTHTPNRGKGGSNEDSTLLVYLDKLLIWVIITIRLLCLRFDENRFMGSMKEHLENCHFSLFEPRVWTLFTAKIFFCHENENEENYLNSQFALFYESVGLIQESNRVMDKNRENRFFHVFPLFLTETPLHLESDCTQFVIFFWKVYSLLNRSAAAPMGIRSRTIARVMVPSST